MDIKEVEAAVRHSKKVTIRIVPPVNDKNPEAKHASNSLIHRCEFKGCAND